jgi:hypothetical protein
MSAVEKESRRSYRLHTQDAENSPLRIRQAYKCDKEHYEHVRRGRAIVRVAGRIILDQTSNWSSTITMYKAAHFAGVMGGHCLTNKRVDTQLGNKNLLIVNREIS